MDLKIRGLAVSRDLHRGKSFLFLLLVHSFFNSKPAFSQDVATDISKELQGKPDLIIGNYSDGNLVASLLAHKLGVTQVCSCFYS